MSKLTATECADKLITRLTAAVPDVRAGIARVTENPCEKAAAKQDKMLAGVTAAVQNGKWARGLKRVTLEDWKKNATEKGVNRIASGITAAKPKLTEFYGQLLPHIDRLQTQVKGMRDLTLEDSIARMTTWVRGMAEFKRT